MPRSLDTIVAVATAPGRGGIGIVRLSGEAARSIVAPLIRLRRPLEHARACVGELLDMTIEGSSNVLDEVIVTFFARPSSFTTEDVVEIAAHGSPVLLDYLVRQCIQRGARLAEPGEFTERAFRSGRIDLTQAEGIQDLVLSTTLHQARIAAGQLRGGLSRSIAPIKAALVELIATLEAVIDFTEDDLAGMPPQLFEARVATIREPLLRLEQSFSQGRLLRDGFSVAIVGRPNAGKSSLFNALLEKERAIVTATAGTTRDLISEQIAVHGIPVNLIDTAGLRSLTGDSSATPDEAERIGIDRARAVIAEADLVLLVLDVTLVPSREDLAILKEHRGRPLLIIANKCDLLSSSQEEKCVPGESWIGQTRHRSATLSAFMDFVADSEEPRKIVATSVITSQGIRELREAMLAAVQALRDTERDSTMLTNLRQHGAVSAALTFLVDAQRSSSNRSPEEIVLIDLHQCLRSLDLLTGSTASEDILDRIFSTFCIGK